MKTPKKDKIRRLAPILVAFVVGAALVKIFVFPGVFRYAGTVEATRVDVPARVSSTIQVRAVNEGDQVKKGQTLLELSCEDLRIAAELARENFDRAQQLFRQGAQSREAYDLARNRKQDADLRIDWCDVRAPLEATVLAKYHEPGEMVSPGTRLFTLADLAQPYAYFYLPQPMIARLSLGMEVRASLPELREKRFIGRIVHIADEAEFTPKNVQTREERTRLVYGVKVEFRNEDRILKPGMTLEAAFPE